MMPGYLILVGALLCIIAMLGGAFDATPRALNCREDEAYVTYMTPSGAAAGCVPVDDLPTLGRGIE